MYIDMEERKRILKIYRDEQRKFMNQIENSTDPSLKMFISSPKNQSKVITVYSLSHTQGTYLQRIVNSFVSILPQLASDLIKFYQIAEKVEGIA